MAGNTDNASFWIERGRRLGIPESKLMEVENSIKKGDRKSLGDLMRYVSSKSRSEVTQKSPSDIFEYVRNMRGNSSDVDKERFPYGKPKGDFFTGRDEYLERQPLYSDIQKKYMDSSLGFAGKAIPQLYKQLNDQSQGGLLTEMFGNNASQGFENLIGQLGGSIGEYLPNALGAGAGAALGGGGIGGILQALIGSAAGQYATKNAGQSPLLNNIASGIGNYYNQGMSALGDLWNNRGDYRR